MATANSKFLAEGLTYDDVLLVPAYSEVLPREVSIATKFSRNITINTPIVSAAMDTVTEYAMAIAIAREGGIGVIHKNMSIEAQAEQVRKALMVEIEKERAEARKRSEDQRKRLELEAGDEGTGE